jgi:diacylglycerol O-acyltransferase / wax synthase
MSASWCERLSPVDATFLYVEGPATPMHVGGIFVYEGRPPSHDEFIDHVASRLERIPRYRQRLAFVPLGLGHPAWVDDPDFDVEYHVRHTTLPSPGGQEAVKRHAGVEFARALDRTRPLWELELVDGVGDDRFVVLSKTHHCLLDGISGNAVIAETTDGTPDVAAPVPPKLFWPRPAPGRAALLARSLRDQISRPLELARGAFTPASEARAKLADLREGLRPMAALARAGRAPASTLNRAINPRRGYEMVTLDLAEVKRIHTAVGATVNDIVLSIVAGALVELLDARGEPRRDDLRAFVPVNVRSPGARDATGNHVAPIYCPLPVAERDPVARVRKVSASMNALKRGKAALATLSIEHLEELLLPPVAATLARIEAGYRRSNLVISNVPGSRTPRYLLGRRLAAFHPLIPLAAGQTLSVGVHTYAGTLSFGILSDGGFERDLPRFARAIAAAYENLVSQTGVRVPVRAPPPVAEVPAPVLAEASNLAAAQAARAR